MPLCYSAQGSTRAAFVFARGEEMAEEAAGQEENNSRNNAKRSVQKPEVCRRHFFEKTADPSDEIIRRKEREIINADDGAG